MRPVTYIYANFTLDCCGFGSNDQLATFTERHKIKLRVPPLEPCRDIAYEIGRTNADGIVFEMVRGWNDLEQIGLARSVLHNQKAVWFYWPAESAIECIDEERLHSYKKLCMLAESLDAIRPASEFVSARILQPARTILNFVGSALTTSSRLAAACASEAGSIASSANPVPFASVPMAGTRIPGTAAYLRTDYWARLNSGGSYGHTCYLAKALARTVDRLVCFSPNHYALLTALGLEQVILPSPSTFIGEPSLVSANGHYYPILKTALSVLRPEFIYERLCLGNYCGARLSHELGIPYIVEYNGSEIEMNRSFTGRRFRHESVYLQAEAAAFRQATAISVVSEPIKDDLVARGIDASKILVNPNGVDPDAYSPVPDDVKAAIRRELGLDPSHRVIGFIGTFGGWHGIDVLAAALPRVCQEHPNARFLLIGDGAHKTLVDRKVSEYNLAGGVIRLGLVPQQEAARLLQACDIYVSPHNRRMTGGRFFGSPTKLFEYMALGGGIVASDLDQIGEVLRPAVWAKDLNGSSPTPVCGERAILCTPGSVDEFVAGIEHLVSDARLCRTLGGNARKAAAEQFSWDCHVDRLWDFVRTRSRTTIAPNPAGPPSPLYTGDDYKNQVQNQWDNNPCGSQYARQAVSHTVEWFREIETHRYGEYAPWMPETMEFALHSGKKVLEIGGGIGTDLAQFAMHGADVTDIDLSAGHLTLAQENFRLRGLQGRFVHQDAERLPFDEETFDVVYSNGVIHHTPNTSLLVDEIYRVLRPGGRVIVMVYAENSLHYWGQQVLRLGLLGGMLRRHSVCEIMSQHVEMTSNGARPLVKVYTRERLRRMFRRFDGVHIVQRQLTAPELPLFLRRLPVGVVGKWIGWNLILKANKPQR